MAGWPPIKSSHLDAEDDRVPSPAESQKKNLLSSIMVYHSHPKGAYGLQNRWAEVSDDI